MLAELLATKQLLITAGSGGVGKTTSAAALAVVAASQGRRVAVLTIDPAKRLADALGLADLTGELRQVDDSAFESAGVPLAEGGELWAMMLDIKTTADQMVRRFAHDEATANTIFENSYYRYFSTALAGTQEYMAVEQVRALVDSNRFDLVVLDTPPAVHALEFLDAPDRMLGALENKAMRLFLKKPGQGFGARLVGRGRALLMKSLEKMTGAAFLEDFATFMSIFSEILEGLREASHAVHALLRADSTSFLVITAPYASNVEEALSFRGSLDKRGLPFGVYVANRVHRSLPEHGTQAEALAWLAGAAVTQPGELLSRMQSALKSHNGLADRERRALKRLHAAELTAPALAPLLPGGARDMAGLFELGQLLLSETE